MARQRQSQPARSSDDDFEFSGPPQIGGGLGLAGLLKLAGYGDDRSELDQYKLLASIAQHRAEQEFKGRQEQREGRKTESDITAAGLKSQIDMLNLQRQIAEMQQEGQTGQLNALVELAKAGDETAKKALSKASQPYAQAKAEERDYANRWEAGKMEAELAEQYRHGDEKKIATYMALQNPNFAANPELAKLIDWQKLAQQWPVDPATPRQGVLTAGVGPAPSGAPQVPSFYEGGGPSAMPGQIDPDMVRLVNQQNAPPARVGQTPSTYRYGTGTMEVPQVAQPTNSGMNMGDFLAATVPGRGMSSPEVINAMMRLFETRGEPSTEPYKVGY